jgi:hypothetical protein
MNSRSFIIFVFLLSIQLVEAQSLSDLKMTLPSMLERYKMDYDVHGLINPSADTLAGLDLDQYEPQRQVDVDVDVFDATTGFTVTLYSVNKAFERYTYRFKKEDEDQ